MMDGIKPQYAIAGALVALALVVFSFWKSFAGGDSRTTARPPDVAMKQYSVEAQKAMQGRGMAGPSGAPGGGAGMVQPGSQPGMQPGGRGAPMLEPPHG